MDLRGLRGARVSLCGVGGGDVMCSVILWVAVGGVDGIWGLVSDDA